MQYIKDIYFANACSIIKLQVKISSNIPIRNVSNVSFLKSF